MGDVCKCLDSKTAAVEQLVAREDDLFHLVSLFLPPAAGRWHMVCVPQLVHWRLSWPGTRDQSGAHAPGDFLQQPCALQL